MNAIVGLIIQAIIGAAGGYAGAAVVKNANMGTGINSIVGAIGGIILGQILENKFGMSPADATAAASSMGPIIQSVIGGGVGGAVLTVIAGLIKNSMSKS